MQSSELISDDLNLKAFDSSNDPITRYAHQVERDILDASNVVRSRLLSLYGESGLEASAPYTGIPFRDVSNTNLDAGGDAFLVSAEAGASAITEWWTLTFSGTANYAAKGSASGSEGTSNITSDFTSTNDGDLKIFAATNTGIWQGTFANGYKFYVATYKHQKIIVSITAMLALSYSLDHLFTAELPNQTEYASTLEGRAMRWLKGIADPYNTGMTLDSEPLVTDVSDIQIPYIELFDVTGSGPLDDDVAVDDYSGYDN